MFTVHRIKGYCSGPAQGGGCVIETLTLTATTKGSCDEWIDDHFGQAFDLPASVIGASREETRAICKNSFWDGCERVEILEVR